jgi:alkaline phosphatase
MISDGFGPASETFARNIYQHEHGLNPLQSIFPLDTMLVGTCRTRPADLNQKEKTPKAQKSGSPITDSAAGATAFSCGIKTYNAGVAGNLKYIENIF